MTYTCMNYDPEMKWQLYLPADLLTSHTSNSLTQGEMLDFKMNLLLIKCGMNVSVVNSMV